MRLRCVVRREAFSCVADSLEGLRRVLKGYFDDVAGRETENEARDDVEAVACCLLLPN